MAQENRTAVAQNGQFPPSSAATELKAEARQATIRLEGADDVSRELAEIGLSEKTGWYASIVMYGLGGLVTVVAGLIFPESIPTGVTILGGFAILLSLVSIYGAKHLSNADWATHMRLCGGLAIFGVGIVTAGEVRLAFVLMPLYVLITPTFLYGARFATPYVILVTPLAFLAVIITAGVAPVAHAVFTTGAILMIVVSFMLAENRTRRLARSNRRLAYTDPLTGIANTRRLRERLTEALGKPYGNGQPFALMAIDLDNFKLVNDTFDHTTGDRVLIAVANALDEEVAEDDLVARRGGDEFSVFVARPQDVDLDALAVRLEAAINRARMATCPQITPSGSVGWVRSEQGDSIASVLQRADDRLHERKLAFHAQHGPRETAVPAAEDMKVVPMRITDRDRAMRSVTAAVSRAYAPRSTSHRRRFENFKQAAGAELARLQPTWAFVALMTLCGGIPLLILSVTGLLPGLPIAIGAACGGVALLTAGVSYLAARRGWDKKYVPLVFIVTLTATAVAMAFAGESGTAMLDIFAVIPLYAFYLLRPRLAGLMLLISCGLYIGFAVGAGYPDGSIRAGVSVSVVLVLSGIVLKVRSITDRFVRTNLELSEVDPLTGVANLRALKLRIENAIHLAEHNEGENVPVIVTVDLDRFKLVNDRYNHTVGDQVLAATARAISECVRVDELVARRGGDEFFVLFDRASVDHIDSVIPRIAEAVVHARQRICPDLIPTASVGYVYWHPGQTAEEFLERADGVMHDEKIDTRERGYQTA